MVRAWNIGYGYGGGGGGVEAPATCLRPSTGGKGTRRLLGSVLRECIVLLFPLLSHPDRKVREGVMKLMERFRSSSSPSKEDNEVVVDICGRVMDTFSALRSSLIMDGACALLNMLGHLTSSSRDVLIEGCGKSRCALRAVDCGPPSDGGCETSAIVLMRWKRPARVRFRCRNGGLVRKRTFWRPCRATAGRTMSYSPRLYASIGFGTSSCQCSRG